MNNRIKEIAHQAYPHDTGIGFHYISDEFKQKFAELIVKECAEICREHGNSAKYSYTPAKALVADNTAQGCASIMERTFGIKNE